jgi:AcrR family transcriptional regulator
VTDSTREHLLAVARELIHQKGYVGISMRTASAAAGIPPEVARRYYRNRDELFAAAMRLPNNPAAAIPALIAPGIEGLGERLVQYTLTTLGDPQARAEIFSLVRTSASAGQTFQGLQDLIGAGIVDRVVAVLGVPDARMRSALITSYLTGLAITRYGMRLEPLASAREDDVVRMVGPVIQDLLDPRKPVPGARRNR